MKEEDALDAILERVAQEEQEELDRGHGQHLLDIAAAGRKEQDRALLELLRRAQAKPAEAQEDNQK